MIINQALALSISPWKIFLSVLFLCFYGVLFYLLYTSPDGLDFSIFYACAKAISQGNNPYQMLLAEPHLSIHLLPVNLNPPFVLLLMQPLSMLNYYSALIIWSIVSFLLGLYGSNLAFTHAFSRDFLAKNRVYLNLIYLAFFATIMNTALAQLGGLLLFLIMSGYDFYFKKRDYAAGLVWSMAIAIKLFPALLVIYVLVQKRYRVCLTILVATILLLFLPLFVYGISIYQDYFSLLSKITWYGKSWNASILGMMYRLGIDNNSPESYLLYYKLFYFMMLFIGMIWYVQGLKKIEKFAIPHLSFCITMPIMLLLSPFGWLYYFTILVFPLGLLFAHQYRDKKYRQIAPWIICLCLINIPINNIAVSSMNFWLEKLTLYSFNFYGLLLLASLLYRLPKHI